MKRFLLNDKRGAAFVMTMIMMVVSLAAIASLYQTLESRQKDISFLIATEAQAKNIAKAAHIDVLNWFRVRAGERENRFFPILDRSDPDNLIDETDDPVVGLVREHVLSENPLLIARYEVRREYYNPSFPDDSNKKDLSKANRIESEYLEIDIKDGARGIKSLRNSSKEVFKIISYGFIFKPKEPNTYTAKDFYKSDPSESFIDTNGEQRNLPIVNSYNHDAIVLLAHARMRSEILLREVKLPFPAAVNYRGKFKVTVRGTVQTFEPDESATTARAPGSNPPQVVANGTLNPATPGENVVVEGDLGIYDDSIEGVFGVPDEQTLASGADTVVFDSVANLDIQSNKINFLGNPASSDLPNFVINSGDNITGSNAFLYVKGNLNIAGNSNFFFSGIIFVVGTLNMNDTAIVDGSIIIKNQRPNNPNIFDRQSIINGNFDAAIVTYQSEVVENLLKSLGQYTFFVPPHFLKNDSEVVNFVE